MRLLVINIFFDPTSFGGATVVAEQVSAVLDGELAYEVTAASASFEQLPEARVMRYQTRFGFDGFAVSLSDPGTQRPLSRTRNEQFDTEMARILDFVEPDIVHIHCVQDIGVSFFDQLVARGIPFVVTVHDFWYFCERQFMIDVTGEFCGQRTIDINRCAVCSSNREETIQRTEYLMGQLRKASLVATPSAYARDMLIANGLESDKVRVNKNGVRQPSAHPADRRGAWTEEPIRVGFVGGPGAIKGWDLIVSSLRQEPELARRLRIVAVDAGSNVGQPWRSELLEGAADLPIEIVPGYRPDNIDEAFEQFDAVICPSRWKETFGLFAREAQIRGKWVIASDAGGLAEDIIDGVNGRVLAFPPSVDAVVSALRELVDRPEKPAFERDGVTTFGEQARELAQWFDELTATAQDVRDQVSPASRPPVQTQTSAQ